MESKPIALLYSRQSLSREGDGGVSVSVADQERMMREVCAREGWIVGGAYRDVDVSGARDVREGLDRLRADLPRLRPRYVVVRDISRLARDVRLFLLLTDEVQAAGAEIVSAIGEPLTDRTLATILSAMSQHDRLMLAGRVAGGVRQHARNGRTHGRVAFGYVRAAGEMLPVAVEAAVVREVFRRYAGGAGIARILDWLHADPTVPPPPAGGAWSWHTVKKMLTRPVYAGDAAIAERRDVGGRLWPAVLSRDAHPPLVDRETWDAVQRRIDAKPSQTRSEIDAPLAGMMRCAACGGRVYPVRCARASRNTSAVFARCGSDAKRRADRLPLTCPGVRKSLVMHEVEAKARDALSAFLASALNPEAMRDANARHAPAEARARDRAEARLADIAKRRGRLLDAYESGGLDLAAWSDRDRLLGADAAAVAAAMAASPEPVTPAAVRRLHETVAGLAGDADALDGAGLRAVLTALGAELLVDLDARSVALTVGEPFASAFPSHRRSL